MVPLCKPGKFRVQSRYSSHLCHIESSQKKLSRVHVCCQHLMFCVKLHRNKLSGLPCIFFNVTIWCALTAHGIIGPNFSSKTLPARLSQGTRDATLQMQGLKGLFHLVQSCLLYRTCIAKDSACSTGHVDHFFLNKILRSLQEINA